MKKYIKNIKYLIIALVVSVFYFSGCDEDDVVVTPPPPFSPLLLVRVLQTLLCMSL
jgi:hypothetical protein